MDYDKIRSYNVIRSHRFAHESVKQEDSDRVSRGVDYGGNGRPNAE